MASGDDESDRDSRHAAAERSPRTAGPSSSVGGRRDLAHVDERRLLRHGRRRDDGLGPRVGDDVRYLARGTGC
jgi:hypothetical protein